ncbi:hypothetical protein SNEBB_011343 [Seison nebaliae]|nr:hypothetical protein SNEBB_011343 [Seison nebaliae]
MFMMLMRDTVVFHIVFTTLLLSLLYGIATIDFLKYFCLVWKRISNIRKVPSKSSTAGSDDIENDSQSKRLTSPADQATLKSGNFSFNPFCEENEEYKNKFGSSSRSSKYFNGKYTPNSSQQQIGKSFAKFPLFSSGPSISQTDSTSKDEDDVVTKLFRFGRKNSPPPVQIRGTYREQLKLDFSSKINHSNFRSIPPTSFGCHKNLIHFEDLKSAIEEIPLRPNRNAAPFTLSSQNSGHNSTLERQIEKVKHSNKSSMESVYRHPDGFSRMVPPQNNPQQFPNYFSGKNVLKWKTDSPEILQKRRASHDRYQSPQNFQRKRKKDSYSDDHTANDMATDLQQMEFGCNGPTDVSLNKKRRYEPSGRTSFRKYEDSYSDERGTIGNSSSNISPNQNSGGIPTSGQNNQENFGTNGVSKKISTPKIKSHFSQASTSCCPKELQSKLDELIAEVFSSEKYFVENRKKMCLHPFHSFNPQNSCPSSDVSYYPNEQQNETNDISSKILSAQNQFVENITKLIQDHFDNQHNIILSSKRNSIGLPIPKTAQDKSESRIGEVSSGSLSSFTGNDTDQEMFDCTSETCSNVPDPDKLVEDESFPKTTMTSNCPNRKRKYSNDSNFHTTHQNGQFLDQSCPTKISRR